MTDFILRFLSALAKDVFWCEGTPDHPTCPHCGSTMSFHGGVRWYGEGFWDCPGCDFSFTEDDLSKFDVYDD